MLQHTKYHGNRNRFEGIIVGVVRLLYVRTPDYEYRPNEKALRGDANTARWLAEPKISPAAAPFWGRGTAKI